VPLILLVTIVVVLLGAAIAVHRSGERLTAGPIACRDCAGRGGPGRRLDPALEPGHIPAEEHPSPDDRALIGLRMPHTGRITGTGGDVRHRYQVLVGLEAGRVGHSSFDGVTVSYHVGSRRYTAHYDYSMRVCALPLSVDLLHTRCNALR